MKLPVVLCSIALFILSAACSSSQPPSELALPVLIYQQPLPSYPRPLTAPVLRIPMEIHVGKDGSVREVRILNGSSDTEWDSAVVSAIRQWRYTPARAAGVPIALWLHQTAVVKFSEPQYMSLAEIICARASEADSVYQMLERGIGFAETARLFSLADSRHRDGSIGTVNIQIYPERIKNVLSGLRSGQYTRPIPYGDWYAIFLRTED